MQLGAISGKVSDAYQAATGSKDNSGLKRTNDGVQYNGRNIMPDVANENMYKFGGNIYANGGSSIEAKKDATLVVGNQPKPSFKENKKIQLKIYLKMYYLFQDLEINLKILNL